MVGLPIFLTMVFCFAMVMAHPTSGSTTARTEASETAATDKAAISANPKPRHKLSASNSASQKKSPSSSSSALHASSSPDTSASSADDSADGLKTGTPQVPDAGNYLQHAAQKDTAPDDKSKSTGKLLKTATKPVESVIQDLEF